MGETRDVTWYEISTDGKRKAPRWGRTLGVDDSGEMWIPAVLCGNETAVFLACSFDNAPVCRNEKHIFVTASWAEREYPDLRPLLAKWRARVAYKPPE